MTEEQLNDMVKDTPYEDLLNMTDEQAADVLEKTMLWISGGRGCGKTITKLSYEIALTRAINKLRGN